MLKKLILAAAIGCVACVPTLCRAQQPIGSYVARLSEADHFNSQGQRLTSAAAIIRQDRANFHRYNIRDPEDQDDAFFADENNRATLEKMLERGRAEPGVISRVVTGTPLVRVDVYRSNAGPFIQVTLLDKAQNTFAKPDDSPKDYVGSFSTEFLYSMCSQSDTASREKCNLYLQGLLYGLDIGRSMQRNGTPVCTSGMTAEAARLRILDFINGITGGNPSNNKDGGDWMAFMGIATGNLCK